MNAIWRTKTGELFFIILPLFTGDVSGCLINTCGWVKGDGYECIKHAAKAFEGELQVSEKGRFNDNDKFTPYLFWPLCEIISDCFDTSIGILLE